MVCFSGARTRASGLALGESSGLAAAFGTITACRFFSIRFRLSRPFPIDPFSMNGMACGIAYLWPAPATVCPFLPHSEPSGCSIFAERFCGPDSQRSRPSPLRRLIGYVTSPTVAPIRGGHLQEQVPYTLRRVPPYAAHECFNLRRWTAAVALLADPKFWSDVRLRTVLNKERSL